MFPLVLFIAAGAALLAFARRGEGEKLASVSQLLQGQSAPYVVVRFKKNGTYPTVHGTLGESDVTTAIYQFKTDPEIEALTSNYGFYLYRTDAPHMPIASKGLPMPAASKDGLW